MSLSVRPVHCPKCDLLLGRVTPRRSDTHQVIGYTFTAATTLHLINDYVVRCPECNAEVPLSRHSPWPPDEVIVTPP